MMCLQGCDCAASEHGCCPDELTPAQGPHNQGCGCQYEEHGCCPDQQTPALGPDLQSCHCTTHVHGCCPDGQTPAKYPMFTIHTWFEIIYSEVLTWKVVISVVNLDAVRMASLQLWDQNTKDVDARLLSMDAAWMEVRLEVNISSAVTSFQESIVTNRL